MAAADVTLPVAEATVPAAGGTSRSPAGRETKATAALNGAP